MIQNLWEILSSPLEVLLCSHRPSTVALQIANLDVEREVSYSAIPIRGLQSFWAHTAWMPDMLGTSSPHLFPKASNLLVRPGQSAAQVCYNACCLKEVAAASCNLL